MDIRSQTVAILGYGNQGRAQALNLRDFGVCVKVGARPEGKAWQAALSDGFSPESFASAAAGSSVVMFLLPDPLIGPAFRDLSALFESGERTAGFAHGFAFHFGLVPKLEGCSYFLFAPKGAGALLRSRFESGAGLPALYAVNEGAPEAARHLARSYAEAVAGNTRFLRETTFALETEGDLFGEQVVLVGGVMELMRHAFDTLTANGHPPELAFFDVCQELQATLDLFLKNGPKGMLERISPTALYGAISRGPRIITQETRKEMDRVFAEVRSGAFAKELMDAMTSGGEKLQAARSVYDGTEWEKTYQTLKPVL